MKRLSQNNFISSNKVSWEQTGVPRNGLLNVWGSKNFIVVIVILYMPDPESVGAWMLVGLNTQCEEQFTHAYNSSHEFCTQFTSCCVCCGGVAMNLHIDGLVQYWLHNSSALAIELLQYCPNPLIYPLWVLHWHQRVHTIAPVRFPRFHWTKPEENIVWAKWITQIYRQL